MITVKVEGLDATLAQLGQHSKQIPFATARALTVTAHDVNRGIQSALRTDIVGGPTPYTLRAFQGRWRDQAKPAGGNPPQSPGRSPGHPYEQSIATLFHGGSRPYKRLEFRLKAQGLMPSGVQLAPGPTHCRGMRTAMPNRPRCRKCSASSALFAATCSSHQRTRARKKPQQQAIGYFVVRAGSIAARHLHPGIYRRIERGSSSIIQPYFYFVAPLRYRKIIDLEGIAARLIPASWPKNFAASFAAAMASANDSRRPHPGLRRRRACRQKLPLSVSEWADANRILSGNRQRRARPLENLAHPYLREIMDHLSEDSPTHVVPFMKCSQFGGTEAGSNWLGYIMDHAKGPCAVIMPTEKASTTG